MEPQPNVSIKSIGFKYGAIVGVALIVYFLIMEALGLTHNVALRFFNYVILGAGLAMAFNEIRRKLHKHRINYLPGLGAGWWVSAIAAIIFGIFIFIYSSFINSEFVVAVKQHLPLQEYISPAMLMFFAAGEIFAFGIILSFVMMQLFKKNRDGDEQVEEAAERRHHDVNNDSTTNSPI